MGATHSKSSIAIASLVALASASSTGVADATRPFTSTAFLPKTRRSLPSSILQVRGGEDATITGDSETKEDLSLDEKVHAAMEKLGLSAPSSADDETTTPPGMECKDGVCAMPGASKEEATQSNADPVEMADRIAKDMSIDSYMAMAAIGATSTIGDANKRIYDESAARAMIQQELDLIEQIPEDSEAVQTLTGEGYDVFMSRRALAFAENNLEDARAILLAEKLDAEEEEQEREAARAASSTPAFETSFDPVAAVEEEAPATTQTSDFVEVKSNFDPTKLPATAAPTPAPTTPSAANSQMPKEAKKEDVVFDITTDQIQEIVLESPVPVLLDVYADWYEDNMSVYAIPNSFCSICSHFDSFLFSNYP